MAYHTNKLIWLYGSLDSENDPVIEPLEFALENIYPCPFNSTARIEYGIEKPSHIKLSIYDLGGREISKLVDGFVESGQHSIALNVGALQSGIYLVALESGDQRIVMRAVLIK